MSSGTLQKSRSCSSLDGSQNGQNSFNNYLTVHVSPSSSASGNKSINERFIAELPIKD